MGERKKNMVVVYLNAKGVPGVKTMTGIRSSRSFDEAADRSWRIVPGDLYEDKIELYTMDRKFLCRDLIGDIWTEGIIDGDTIKLHDNDKGERGYIIGRETAKCPA